jgi:FecR protein
MRKMKKLCAGVLTSIAALLFAGANVLGADGLVLQRISGQLDYQPKPDENREAIVGQLLVQPRGYALTRTQSMAAIDLPDSSVVSIGASSRVGLGHFERETWGSRSLMTIYDGAIHFAVKHPAGARANYTFVTPTSQVAIRGTEGIIVVRGDETIIACVHGTNNDTLVMYGRGRQMYVPVGMTVRIRGAMGTAAIMSMRRGIAGPEFDQFKAIVARNHAMRMRGLQK